MNEEQIHYKEENFAWRNTAHLKLKRIVYHTFSS